MKSSAVSLYDKLLFPVLVLFYFCSLEPISMITALGFSKLFTLGRYISYLCLGLLAMYNLSGRKSFNPWQWIVDDIAFLRRHMLLVVVGLCFLFSSLMASVLEPLLIVLLLAACWKVKLDSLLKVILGTQFVYFVLVLLGGLSGVLENLVFLRDGEMRMSLGFIYPLELQSLLFFMSLTLLYLLRKRLNWIWILLVMVVNLVFYFFTRARFSTLLLVLACLVLLYFRYVKGWLDRIFQAKKEPETNKSSEKKRGWNWGWTWITLWVSGLSLMYYTISQQFLFSFRMRPLFKLLDRIFNNRIVMARGAYVDYGWQAFGKTIEWIGLGGVKGEYWIDKVGKIYNYVDVSYFKNLFDYGYVFLFFVLLAYGIVWYRSIQKKQYTLATVLAMILMGAVFEPRLVQIALNPFLLFGAPLLMVSNTAVLQWLDKIHLYGISKEKIHG